MTILITFALCVVLVCVLVWKISSANREAKRLNKLQNERRVKAANEVLDKLEKIKNRDDVDRARAAVAKDPERAAKIVGNMMKKK